MRFRSLRRCTRAAVRVLFRVVSGFLFGFSFQVPFYTFCVLRGAFLRSLGCWFGFPLYT
jgi:hypothetical protein